MAAKKIDEAQPKTDLQSRVIQEWDTVKDLPLALPDNARKKSVVALNQILADTMMLRDLYKKAHWQISGATFYALHLLLDKHYEEQAEAVDTIAERVMALGGISHATPHDVAEATTIPRPPKGREDVPSNLQRLLQAHEGALKYMREAASEAAEYGDDGTQRRDRLRSDPRPRSAGLVHRRAPDGDPHPARRSRDPVDGTRLS